ncbi:apoptosis-inducing factor 3-like [Diorhabda sublineata]|uniref:apoptosis-inducing factor 3-like n=1 Tax=Diorhabda sublineata TaxID=1163346 RepID=UPI0024E0CC37|nr:apoptosis-inducing factor 3-like [Diorhabda sublineata]
MLHSVSPLFRNFQYLTVSFRSIPNLFRYKMSSSDDYVEDVVCKVSDLEENKLKTFQLQDEGEVLLVKQNNIISALGSKCTHYGAPLVNGAIGNGRVRCPWHGACFNLSNGDIEEYPGLDSLPYYKVTIEGDNVKVRAKKDDLLTNKRIKHMVGKCQFDKSSIVIVGGGPAAATCAETLRQEDYEGDITMICKENYLPYDRVRLSKQIGLNIDTALLRNEDFYQKYNINVVKGIDATSVDTVNKTVTLRNNSCLGYNKLFIATGNKARRPCIPGAHLENVLVLRSYEDSKLAKSSLSTEKEMVIIGSSFIAMEVADYCKDKVKKLTVIMRDEVPFKPVLGPRIGEAILNLFKKNGINFIAKMGVDAINGKDKVESVKLHDGTIMPADLVLLGTGSNTDTAFLKNSGIQLQENGTIETDEYLQSNVQDVYIGGDIALAPVWSSGNKKAAIGHFGLAHYHGKIAALNMAGKRTKLKTVPYFWTKLGPLSIRYCGHGTFDDIIYTGNVEELKFVAFYLKDDVVVAISSCGMDPYVSQFAELLAKGRRLHRSDLRGDDPLKWAK